ncbi:hypothetical protein HMPREF9372_0051 [Sporosarcina newyorkensis 2681]|uniref:Holin-like toxin n=1 Tax=Sporosarcina newyorkensis 2681 TaxID=1027292 RepID=F9DMM1_9BACL|nr:hypothetical protein HMPREF9372_0051 [Sporosarcina newyorkensis 2681]
MGGWHSLVKGGVYMVTYEAMNMLFQFGMFLAAMATVIVAMIALFINRKK